MASHRQAVRIIFETLNAKVKFDYYLLQYEQNSFSNTSTTQAGCLRHRRSQHSFGSSL